MKNKPFSLTILALGCACATTAWAQASGTGSLASGVSSTGAFDPKPAVKLGGFAITPTLTTVVGHNDNVTLQPEGLAVSSKFVTVAPQVVAEAAYRADRYTLSYAGDYTRNTSRSRADADNHEFFAGGQNQFTARSSLDWRLGYLNKFDPLGTDLNAGSDIPDHYSARVANALYRYGAQGAQGRIELGLDLEDKAYKTNNLPRAAQGDKVTRNVAGRFFYRVAPRTELLAEYRNTNADFDTALLDNTEHRVMLGATWEATAATTGTLKVGQLRKNYDASANRRDFSGGSWEGNVRWEPLTYSALDLTVGRYTSDPVGTAANVNYLLTNNNSVEWTHKWTSYLQSSVKAGRTSTKYVGNGREDDLDVAGVGLKYTFRSWLRAGVAYEHSKRDSNVSTFDYTRNLVKAQAEIGF